MNPFFSKAIFSWNVPGVDGGDVIGFYRFRRHDAVTRAEMI